MVIIETLPEDLPEDVPYQMCGVVSPQQNSREEAMQRF